MSEIKFRAFDKGSGKICDVYSIDWKENQAFISYDNKSDWNVTRKGWEGYRDLENLTLMQYTGLKDYDGVVIYEGDILEDHYWNSMWFTRNIEVKIPDIYGWLNHRIKKGSYYRIIGNIYENPDLLEGE